MQAAGALRRRGWWLIRCSGPGKEAYAYSPGHAASAGARYAIVRPEIRRIRPIRAHEPIQPVRFWSFSAMTIRTISRGSWPALAAQLPEGGLRLGYVIVRPYHSTSTSCKTLAERFVRKRLEVHSEPERDRPTRIAAVSLRCDGGERLVAGTGLRGRAAVDHRAVGECTGRCAHAAWRKRGAATCSQARMRMCRRRRCGRR